MNDSESWAQGFRCYEQLKVVDDMSYFGSWAQGFGYYEQHRVVEDMNDLGSHELRPLDALNSLRL